MSKYKKLNPTEDLLKFMKEQDLDITQMKVRTFTNDTLEENLSEYEVIDLAICHFLFDDMEDEDDISTIIKEIWKLVNSDSGALCLFSKRYSKDEMLNFFARSIFYNQYGMTIDFSRKDYNGILIRKVR